MPIFRRYVEVKNLHGTSEQKPPKGYDSWMDYWEKKAERTVKNCCAKDCNNRCNVGAHVKKETGKKYIIPFAMNVTCEMMKSLC